MATNPAAQNEQVLPLFYKSLAPLSSQLHPSHKIRSRTTFPEAHATHAVPLTVDEFVAAQRHYPIVFGVGDNPAPLALLGLSDGQNMFVDADGNWRQDTYIPAYVRRYPFMLAKLTPEAQDLTLCFDNSSDLVAAGDFEGQTLFDGEEPTEATKGILRFCEQFEEAVTRTRLFMEELQKLDVIIDGEVTIQQEGLAQPAVYRGFRMVSEDKIRELRGDQLRKIVQNGMLGIIYAHMYSLGNVRELFARQMMAAAA
jgi:hypothetical protein